MDTSWNWSVAVAQGERSSLRVHAHWGTFAALLAAGVWRTGHPGWGWYVVFLGTLLLSTLVHEAGHAWVARVLRIPIARWVLWPLGGIPGSLPGLDSRRVLWLAVAGPGANLLGAWAAWSILKLNGSTPANPTEVLVSLNSLAPAQLALWLLQLFFWTNLALALVNLLPARALDAGWAWQHLGRRSAQSPMLRHATALSGLGMCVGALMLGPSWEFLVPALLGMGMVIFLAAVPESLGPSQPECADQPEENPAWAPMPWAPEPSMAQQQECREPASGESEHWLARETPEPLQPSWTPSTEDTEEQQLEQQVDRLLARIHDHGLQDLSPEELALLHRASLHYRHRLRQRGHGEAEQ